MNYETSTDASRILFIDSRDGRNNNADPQLTTDYFINIQDPIVVPNHHTILLSLHRVNIPRTFYNFEKNRNAGVEIRFEGLGGGTASGFGARYTGGVGLPHLVFQVNEGNYDAISTMNLLLTRVNDYLTTGTSRFSNRNLDASDVGKYTFSMNYNEDALKYEFKIEPADQTQSGDSIRMSWLWRSSTNFGSDILYNTTNKLDTTIRQEVGFITNKWYNGTTQDFYIEFQGATLPQDRVWRGGYGVVPLDAGAPSQTDTWGTPIRAFQLTTDTALNGVLLANGIEFFKGYDDGDTPQETGNNNYFSCVDMNYHTSNLYLHTSITQNSVLDSRIGCRYSNILARIPVSVESGEEVIVSPSDGSVHKLILKVRQIDQIKIRLTDLDDNPINLQGLDWTMSLEFDFIETPEIKVKQGARESIEAKKYEMYLKEQGKLDELRKLKQTEGKIENPNV